MSYTQFGYSTYATSSPIVIGSSTPQNSCYERNSPETHLYPRIPSYATAPPYQPDSNLDPAAASFYTPTLNSTYGMKEGSDPWRSISQSASYYYDPTLAAYGYGGLDFNGARRKNVTRDSTSTLKAWLNEHRKNPYPTKGEKIMLAIITKMTLTQVSTWFANARRRLKKENKMTWEPRNKAESQDEDPKKEPKDDDEEDEKPPRIPIGNGADVGGDETFRSAMSDRQHQLHYEDSHASVDALHASLEASSSGFTPSVSSQSSSPDIGPMESYMASHHRSSKDSTTVSSCFTGDHLYKPKIWSLADTATNKVLEMPYANDLSSNGWSPTKTTPYQSCAAIPFQRFSGYSCNLHGFNPITLQTDTPPQTPPNMKMVPGHQAVPSSAYIEPHPGYLNQQPPPPPPLCSQDAITDGQMQDEKMESFAGNHPSVLSGNASSNQNTPSDCISEDYDEPPRYSVR